MVQEESQNIQLTSEDAEGLQELYADSLMVNSNIYTATLAFGDLRPGQPPLNRVRIKVSPHMLKAISLLAGKHVRELETATGGPIRLPNDLVHRWGLEEEIR